MTKMKFQQIKPYLSPAAALCTYLQEQTDRYVDEHGIPFKDWPTIGQIATQMMLLSYMMGFYEVDLLKGTSPPSLVEQCDTMAESLKQLLSIREACEATQEEMEAAESEAQREDA
jgi:hypothetical protein